MKPFNLAEARILERNYCQAQINKYLSSIAAMIVLTAIVAGGCGVCKSMFAGQVQETKSKLVIAQDRYLRAKKEMSVINARVSEKKWQHQLAAESKRWLRVLESALGSVPSDVWLESVQNSDKESKIAIVGRAYSLDGVTQLISALKTHPEFGDVRLDSVKSDSSNGITSVGFALTIVLGQARGVDGASDTQAQQPAAGLRAENVRGAI
ncbi:MAG: PilN domain-containing protein [Armatimonadota bacterium]